MSTDITPDEILKLIETHGPTLILHPDERYKFCSFTEFLIDPAFFLAGHHDKKTPVPDPLPAGKHSKKDYLGYEWGNAGIEGGDIASAVAYVHALPSNRYVKGGIQLQFWICYTYNGPGNAILDLKLRFESVFKNAKVKFRQDISTAPFGEH